MAPIPVICQKCGRAWLAHNIFGGHFTATLVGNTVAPCPYCSGVGRIPDGVYEVAGDVTRLLTALPPDDLRRLSDALETAVAEGESDARVKERVAESVPAVASGMLSVRKTTISCIHRTSKLRLELFPYEIRD